MKIFKILILFFVFSMIPAYAIDNCVQINYCQQKSCYSNPTKYKKHTHKKIKRYFTAKRVYKNSKPKQYVIVKKQQPQIREQYPEIFQNSVEINNSQIYINPVITKAEPVQQQQQQIQQVIVTQSIQQKPHRPLKNHSNLVLKTGLNTCSTMKVTCEDESETYDVDNSVFVGAEYTLIRDSRLQSGIGALYAFNKEHNDVPVYGFLKYKVGQVYLTGSLGYNFFIMNDKPENVKVKNGIYYAIGLEGPTNSQIRLFSEFTAYTNQLEVTLPCSKKLDFDYQYNKLAIGLKIEI